MAAINAGEFPSGFNVAVIGGGPAGLMAAEVLSQHGAQVDLFDAMPSLGRKFLLAGIGGMNITHAEPADKFLSRYGERQIQIATWLRDFNSENLRAWVHELGIETFVGSSGRVFPGDMKAAPLLRAWLKRLRESGVTFHTRHRWLGWSDKHLRFETPHGEKTYAADSAILALGGGSWAKLGSDGRWVPLLRQQGIEIADLQPANCGFEVAWSRPFRERFAGQPLKSIAAAIAFDVTDDERPGHIETVPIEPHHRDNRKNYTQLHRPTQPSPPAHQKGECLITAAGIEGGLVYSLSAPLREQISEFGSARLYIDLAPDRTLDNIVQALQKLRGSNSLSNQLRKQLNLSGVKAGLLYEIATAQQRSDPVALASLIKRLPIVLRHVRPLDEAISSAGGIRFNALDEHLMLHALPGVFCAGEMLDWEAPTGGYLLTACFASGRTAAIGALEWWRNKHKTA